MTRPHNISKAIWEDAKRQARDAMIVAARSAKGMIAYGDLTAKITSLPLVPDSTGLRELLGEISREEDQAGHGMLSVVVVHKAGNDRGRPGNGFFSLARELGRDTRDKDKFWISEFEKVRAFCKRDQS